MITHTPTGKKTTFGKVSIAASQLEVPKDLSLKYQKERKIIGKSVNRINGVADKVTGKQVYAIDLKLPGMLVASIKNRQFLVAK